MNEQTKTRMAAIFNEWARRYAESPDSFAPILDEHGQPAEDYREMATRYFQEISDAMEKAEILSQVRQIPLQGKPFHPMDREYLSHAASLVQALLPDNHVFFLLVVPVGKDGRASYTGSMQRGDAINVMKEFIIKAGAREDWMKHIK